MQRAHIILFIYIYYSNAAVLWIIKILYTMHIFLWATMYTYISIYIPTAIALFDTPAPAWTATSLYRTSDHDDIPGICLH